MKNLSALIFVGILFATASVPSLCAADAEFVAPQETRPAPSREQVAPVRQTPSFSGIIAQIFRAPQPLQMINPLAPSYYGSGKDNMVSGENDSVKGANSPLLVFFGIEW